MQSIDLFSRPVHRHAARGFPTHPASPLSCCAGVREHAHFLKTLEDAKKLRKRVNQCFEMASLPSMSEAEKRRLLTFVVVRCPSAGVGASGGERGPWQRCSSSSLLLLPARTRSCAQLPAGWSAPSCSSRPVRTHKLTPGSCLGHIILRALLRCSSTPCEHRLAAVRRRPDGR